MERNFKHISDELKLPQASRERIRSELAAYQVQWEGIPMKKTVSKTRVPFLAAAAVMAAALTVTAASVVVQRFRNDMIVSGVEDIPVSSNEGDAPSAVAIAGPNGNSPTALEEMIKSERFKSDDWTEGNAIHGGVLSEYHQWDFVEVLSSDPELRIRRVGRSDGAEKMEYTAENPAALVDTLTGRVTFDLSWMSDQYDHIPDANMSFVVTDADGEYVSEAFSVLYAKPDGSGYVCVELENMAQENYYAQSYIMDGSYETAYYYTSPDGYEFLITMNNGIVWADCSTSHAGISLYGAYLTSDEVEDIIDNLSLSFSGDG